MSTSNIAARAAVFIAPGQPLEMQSFALPDLDEGEGLVAVECCTLCGSDFHSIDGRRRVESPMILGHEVVGRLLQATDGLCDVYGAPVAQGERISWSIAASCSACFFCQNGLPQKCDQLFKYGHRRVDREHPLSGGLATHCHLARGTPIVKVPEELPDFVACPVNCSTATVAAAVRIAGDCTGRSVVLIGAGMLGLTASAMCRQNGAKHVIISDIDPKRAAAAVRFGATHTELDSLQRLTDGRGADLVFDMSGSPQAMESALNMLRVGGRMILVGAVFPDRAISIHAEQIVRRMLRIEGIHNYAPQDLSSAMVFLQETHGQFPFQQLVEGEFRLDDVNQAIQVAKQKRMIRVAIRP